MITIKANKHITIKNQFKVFRWKMLNFKLCVKCLNVCIKTNFLNTRFIQKAVNKCKL